MTAPCARRGASSRPEAQSSLAAPTGLRLPDTPNPDSDGVGERAGGAECLPHFVAASTRRAAAGLFLFFLALLGIQGVAHAQQEIYSGTLTVGATSTQPNLFGFNGGHTDGTDILGNMGSDIERFIPELDVNNRDSFFPTLSLLTNENGTLILEFVDVKDSHLDDETFRARLTLHINTTAFAMADASWRSSFDQQSTFTWTNSGLTWADSETYSVRITLAYPTAVLHLMPNSIGENGGSSSVTATLNGTSSAETVLTVSAVAGANATDGDFTLSANTTLTIAAGDTTSTGMVTIGAVNNDADEPNKEVTVSAVATNSVGVTTPGDVTLTIVDDGDRLLPEETLAVKALLTRIGRTVSVQVVDALGRRMLGAMSGPNVTLAGQRLPFGAAPLPQANAFVGQGPWDVRPLSHEWNQISGERKDLHRTSIRSITSQEILAGSSFSLRLAEDDDESKNTGRWTAWGLTAQSGFDGRDDDLLLNGDVTTVMMGLDAEWEQTMAGATVAHSSGDGAFEENGACDGPRCKGSLKTQLTGIYPYLRHDVNERVSLSGVLGYAKGDLAFSGDSTGIESGTVALSARGALQPTATASEFELAARLDAFLNWVRMEETAKREAIEANTSRLRLVLEASRTLALDSDRALTSTMQLGLRHDGGDAEIGHGVDIKAALRYADPARGLSVEGEIHRLISHEDADYEEQGVSASVRLSPDAAGLGLSLSLASFWSAGATRTNPWPILSAETLSENLNFNSAVHLNAELGYGLATFGNQSVHTPYFGLSSSKTGETTERLGWRLRSGSDFTLKLETARHHQSDGESPQNSFGLQISTPW